ncbi:hypothetical protein DNTS_009433 [Danionella cerebrum]|uniref:Uncharacterized protein n=1 Tax=Danionella cerebrum TaxID=2873325 RepID=A0A553NIG6_9TELE|nr:hypothetical protein DNTS_009433 [Danionella translucida]
MFMSDINLSLKCYEKWSKNCEQQSSEESGGSALPLRSSKWRTAASAVSSAERAVDNKCSVLQTRAPCGSRNGLSDLPRMNRISTFLLERRSELWKESTSSFDSVCDAHDSQLPHRDSIRKLLQTCASESMTCRILSFAPGLHSSERRTHDHRIPTFEKLGCVQLCTWCHQRFLRSTLKADGGRGDKNISCLPRDLLGVFPDEGTQPKAWFQELRSSGEAGAGGGMLQWVEYQAIIRSADVWKLLQISFTGSTAGAGPAGPSASDSKWQFEFVLKEGVPKGSVLHRDLELTLIPAADAAPSGGFAAYSLRFSSAWIAGDTGAERSAFLYAAAASLSVVKLLSCRSSVLLQIIIITIIAASKACTSDETIDPGSAL